MVGPMCAHGSLVQDSQGDKGWTNFRATAMRASVMGRDEKCMLRSNITSATNFRPTAVRAGVMGPSKIADAASCHDPSARAGMVGPASSTRFPRSQHHGCD